MKMPVYFEQHEWLTVIEALECHASKNQLETNVAVRTGQRELRRLATVIKEKIAPKEAA